MSASPEFIFYDLPSRGTHPTAWSLNPWKARLVLNYKRIPYKTQWIEYPDIKPTFQSFSIPPNTPEVNPNAEYSIPVAKFPDGRYIMDSLQIAREIEKLQPEPSLGLDTDYPAKTQAAVAKFTAALAPIVIPRVPELLLNETSQPYFNSTREKRFGMPLTELAKSDKAGEKAWESASPGLSNIKAILEENPEGPYVMGNEPTFADFILAGLWQFYWRLDKGGDLFERTLGYDKKFREHYEACREWLERDD